MAHLYRKARSPFSEGRHRSPHRGHGRLGCHFPGVDEDGMFAAVATFSVVFVLDDEPEADGNLRAVEEQAGKGNHAVHEVGLDEGFADVAAAF